MMLEFPVRPRFPQLTLRIKLIYIDNYKSELMFGLGEAWDLARKEFQKSQRNRSTSMIAMLSREISELVIG